MVIYGEPTEGSGQMAKRKIPYEKVAIGFQHCFGAFGRECDGCPYDKYNDKDDLFGDAPDYCIGRLATDAKCWGDELEFFCHCQDCCLWHEDRERKGEGRCDMFNTDFSGGEFCSRGCKKDTEK